VSSESSPDVTTTSRLALRRWQAGDAELVAPIYAKSEVMRFIPGGTWSIEQTRRIVDRMTELERENGFGYYPVVRRSGGAPIGHCGLGRLENGDEIEVAYVFDVPFWRQGYASEAAAAAVAFGFEVGIERIVAVAFPENAGSIGVMRKIGMHRVGRAHHFGATLEKYEIIRPSDFRRGGDLRA
jgi:RimJ/RimL family protein N-acetyltransferase